jgi:hypothetical protein
VYINTKTARLKQRTRLIKNYTVTNFQQLLKNDTRKAIYINEAISSRFNTFLSIFLNIFEASFPVKNVLVTKCIKVSCISSA